MAEDGKKGGNAWLAFIVGGLIVVVAIIAWVMYSGGAVVPDGNDVDVDIDLPEAPSLPEPPANPIPDPPAPDPAPVPTE